MEAVPIATPRIRRATNSMTMPVAAALSSEPSAKRAAITMMIGLRPKRSVRLPPKAAPPTAPIRTAVVTTPCIQALRA